MSIGSLLVAVSIVAFAAAGFSALVFVAVFIRPRVFMGVGLAASAVVFLFSPMDAAMLLAVLSCACLSCQCRNALADL